MRSLPLLGSAGAGVPPGAVEVRFEESGEVTIVHFEHRDLDRMGPGAAETLQEMDGGWGMLLGLYKAAAERG